MCCECLCVCVCVTFRGGFSYHTLCVVTDYLYAFYYYYHGWGGWWSELARLYSHPSITTTSFHNFYWMPFFTLPSPSPLLPRMGTKLYPPLSLSFSFSLSLSLSRTILTFILVSLARFQGLSRHSATPITLFLHS